MLIIALAPSALAADDGDDARDFGAVGRAAVQAARIADKHVTGLHEQRFKGDVAGVDFGDGLFFLQHMGTAGDFDGAVLGTHIYEGEVDRDQRRRIDGPLLREEASHVGVDRLVDRTRKWRVSGVLGNGHVFAQQPCDDGNDSLVGENAGVVKGRNQWK